MNKTKRGSRVEQGSGNVFRDLGFPIPSASSSRPI